MKRLNDHPDIRRAERTGCAHKLPPRAFCDVCGAELEPDDYVYYIVNIKIGCSYCVQSISAEKEFERMV